MKVLFISLLFFTGGLTPEESSCDSLKLKLDISHTSKGEQNGKILISVIKGRAPYKTFLFAEKRQDNRQDFKLDELKGLTSGKYTLIVQDGSGCTFQQTIKLK